MGYIFQCFIEQDELMLHSSLSAVNVSDKQDPSLVADVTCLHMYFTKYGYLAIGVYLKALQYLLEAFLQKDLSPYERTYKVWWTKKIFVTCFEGVSERTQFVSNEFYYDIVCSCDALILYFLILKDKFPDIEIVSWFLGSDQNEQLFAYITILGYL